MLSGTIHLRYLTDALLEKLEMKTVILTASQIESFYLGAECAELLGDAEIKSDLLALAELGEGAEVDALRVARGEQDADRVVRATL